MDIKTFKKKMRLKTELMLNAGAYLEGLCDYDEVAKVLKSKDFTRKSRKSFMKDYKKALTTLDKEFSNSPNLVKDKERDK